MVELKNLSIDPAKGRWVAFGDGVELLIASARNRPFVREHRAAMRPYAERLRDDDVEPEELQRIVAPSVARHLLKDWKGVEEDGKPLPYTAERGQALLASEGFAPMVDFILKHARDDSKYRAPREAAEKN